MISLSEKNSTKLFNMLSADENIIPGFQKNLSASDVFSLILSIDDNYSVIFSSQSFNNLGFTDDKKFNLKALIAEDEFEDFKYHINRCLKLCKSNFQSEFHINTPDGNTYLHIANIQIIKENNKPVTIEAILMNVENIKYNDAELQRHKNIIASPDFVFFQGSIDKKNTIETEFLSFNCSFYSLLKLRTKGSKFQLTDLIHNDDKENFFNKVKLFRIKKRTFTDAVRIVSPFNKVFWIIIEVNSVKIIDNKVYFNMIFYNINNLVESIKQLSDNQKELSSNLKQSKLITNVLKLLQVTEDYETSMQIILKELCEYINTSEAAFLIPQPNGRTNSYVYNLVEKDFVITKNTVTCTDEFPNITSRLNSFGTAYKDSSNCSKNCCEEFSKMKIKACLIFKVVTNQSNCYIYCIDNSNTRVWNNGDISIFKDISQVISGLFHKYLISQELNTAKLTLNTVLDNINSLVIASSLQDNKIIYSNKIFIDTFGNNTQGKYLWDVLKIEKSKIINPTEEKTENNKRLYEIYCPEVNKYFDVTEVDLNWNDGKKVRLSTMNDISEKAAYEKLIETQANTDHLTGLPNRRMLEKDFPVLLKNAENAESFGYILFLDLDNFKNVNDGLGHPYGDALLQEIGQFLLNLSFKTVHCYRFGGDEFVILVPHINVDKINDITDEIYNKFQDKWNILNTEYFCTASIGIARFPYDGYDLFDIMKKVDMAMYHAKKFGKNRIMHYKTKIGAESIRTIEIERYLKESVLNNFAGFSVNYQPIINSKTKQISGSEALLRWHSDNYGDISPVEFIPLAESLGLIVKLGEFVLTNSCKECKYIIDNINPDFIISVNLSILQLSEPNIVSKVSKIITESGVNFKNIGFEVTESIAVNDMNKTKAILKEFADLGINILLDDFGTGFSSLNYIKSMPLNTIKIDKSFIDDLTISKNTEVFISTIIELAHALNINVCAEGVEEEEQYNILNNLSADNIQGFYFGKPMLPTQLLTLLKKSEE